jgi:hypothetical protein
MQRTCATPGCGAEIPPQKGSARPRKYCTGCRPPRGRPNPRVVHLPAAPQAAALDDQPTPSRVVVAYRRQLEEAERLDTPDGAHVMHLAELFGAGNHTAAGAASLSRELRAAMEVAIKGAPSKADRLDELSARRQAKAEGA